MIQYKYYIYLMNQLMKFKINKKLIESEISIVSKIINNKANLLSLSGIKFIVDKDLIFLKSLNIDNKIFITSKIDKSSNLEINETGEFLIKSKILIDTVKKIDEETILFEILDKNELIIKTKNYKSKLKLLDVKDFPKKKDEDTVTDYIEIERNVLKKAINETYFCINANDSRHPLRGLNFEKSKEFLKFISTDSFRLSKVVYKVEQIKSTDFNIIIPYQILNELLRIISAKYQEKSVYFYQNKKSIYFKIGNLIINTSLLNFKYPNTNDFFPKSHNLKIILDRRNLIKSIDRINVLSEYSDYTIINFEINQQKIKLKSKNIEIGESEEIITKFKIEGNNLDINFNSRYLNEALKSFDSKNIVLKFISDSKPLIIEEEDINEKTHKNTQLILPIKTMR